jgi:Transcriptional regulators
MEAAPTNGPKDDILREVGALARCVQSINDSKYREIGLQRGQFIFLTRVCEHPGINLIELSSLLKVDKTTTTKAVQKLLAESYVTRERDKADKRMWRLAPSARAMHDYPRIIAEENRLADTCLAGFSAEEQAVARRLLRRMRENIEQDWLALKAAGGEHNDDRHG